MTENVTRPEPPTDPNSKAAHEGSQRACSLMVFGPDPLVTVTVEAGGHGDEVHLHPGGQGFWLARMAASLGADTILCSPFGGETGRVARHLMSDHQFRLLAVPVSSDNGSYIHDRRSGKRSELASMSPVALSRHDVDDLYGCALTAGLNAKVCVLGGPGPWDPPVIASSVYERLARDLRANGRTVVADLSGATLEAALTGGVDVLKVSHEDLRRDGVTGSEDIDGLVIAMESLAAAGAANVIVSRADAPALALLGGTMYEVMGPRLTALDHRGAGDSMTAGLAAGLARGLELTAALRLGAAAGALNVTRHGLASGAQSEIEALATQVHLQVRQTSGAR